MNDIERRKTFQRLKSLSNDQFWEQMNVLHSKAYFLGQKHVREAMECTVGISNHKIEEVLKKATEIRETWDGIHEVNLNDTEELEYKQTFGRDEHANSNQ